MKSNRYINSVNLNNNTDFPYLVLNVINENSYPKNPGFRVMHWHEDIQFIYVQDGEIEVITLDARIILHRGDGIFINKNVVHLVNKLHSCHYNSFIFPDYFLKFYIGSPAGNMVENIIGNDNVPFFYISNCETNKSILHNLKKLSSLENNKSKLYPYEVLLTLCTLWLELFRVIDIENLKPNKLYNQVEHRMSIFLQYIEQHYAEDISLDLLAKSANVSKSECLRCFKTTLNTTPYKYLIEYRLSKAAIMLTSTDLPIEHISLNAGFQHLSHFGKSFREKTGLSPSAYRKCQK